MKKKPNLYFNKLTGDIVRVTRKQAGKLPDHIRKIEFMKKDGVDIMRFNFDNAVVDVSENENPEAEVLDSTNSIDDGKGGRIKF